MGESTFVKRAESREKCVRYKITGKRPEDGISNFSFHTITEFLNGSSEDEAKISYKKLHPHYVITDCVPWAIKSDK